MCPAAAFAIRNFASEMVYASAPELRALERKRLNDSSHSLRSWHERLLFASSTADFEAGAVQYMSRTAVPTYRATPVIEQVRRSLHVCTTSLGCYVYWLTLSINVSDTS